uniref:Enhancer of mRNA-decapping protein 4 n=1 Tax=Gouania willdenowi TaxID=441366 RepID=A0A8C5H859_GOUWI
MASNTNIDIEDATQHLRDILKLDRPGNGADSQPSEGQRKHSFNGELNGLLGVGLLGNPDRTTMSESTCPISTDLCSAQESQKICLSGDDGSTCIPITSTNVEIVASQDSSINSKARGSNKVKIQPVAKYDWEHKYYYGRLIAVSNAFLAYAIRGANNHAMIRVLSLGFTERSLLKGFTGAVTDLAFAHLDSSLLGCVDEAGNLMVWQLTCTDGKILDEIVIHVQRPEDTPLNSHRRLIWCPFILDDTEENQDDISQTLALLHEDRAEVWDLEVLKANHSSWPVDASELKDGLITIKGHMQRVSEGALSPDGTVLATASYDGYIKFWQIYIEGVQDKPRCLHELRPHGGHPVSCLLFCDNHKRQDPDVPFWRFLITGANQNQELKMWCTVSWTFSGSIFGIRDVTQSRLRHTEVLPAEEESETMTTEGTQGPSESKSGIQIKLYSVFSDHLTDQSSDKESGNGSQTELSKIPSLPGPSDFLSNSANSSGLMPKLMTPDAFMTPSTSVPASPGSSASSLTIVTATSSNSDSTNSKIFNGPLALDNPEVLEPPLLPHLASPTRARSPDVISSASTAMSQDMPEIASQTLQLQRLMPSLDPVPLSALQADSMASAASALHLLTSPLESEPRLSNTPSLLENALSHENPGTGAASSEGSISITPWPAAPDITRETRNSLRDNGLVDSSREESKDRHLSSPYHLHSYHLTQNNSQDAGAEQSDPEDEVESLASSTGKCSSRGSHRIPVKDWKTSPRGSPKLKRKLKKDEGESLQSRQMDSALVAQEELLMLLRSQQRELTELRGKLETMQSSIMSQVEHVLANHHEQEHRRLERILSESQIHQQQFQEQLSQHLGHTLSIAMTNRVDKVLREEIKKTVPQTISKTLEPVAGQLNNTITAKLTNVEVTLKDNVTKVVKSKNITDAIGRAAAEAMQGPIQAAYKDAFQSVVLPVFERGCHSMFQQINDSFKQGTHEYIQQLETHMKSKKQREQDARDPVVVQLQQMIDGFQNSTDQLANNISTNVRAEVQHQIQMSVGNMQESILSHVQRIVKGEVGLAMKEQQAVVTSSIMQAMRSAAGTPVPTAHLDYQTQQANILQLLQQGQLNQAFQQALSATDLNLVLYVCETIDSQQVFGQHPCPLSQPVLLSLIQQLSSNLSTRSELKISYLEDAVMNLDHGDSLTRDHMASVLAQVRPKLFAFLQQDPHSPLSKTARRLMMMLQGLVNH